MARVPTILACLAIAAYAQMSAAQTLYVSDELVITVRTGPSTRNAIVDNISAGQAVEVLEESDDGSYYRIRVLADGTEGWALSQYLVPERAAADRLAEARRELERAGNRITELEQTVAGLSGRLDTTENALGAAERAKQTMAAELDDIRRASSDVLGLREQNDNLRERVAELSQAVDQLTMERAALESRSRQNWFVVGAAVLLAGIIVGLVAPSLRRRRASRW